SRKNPPGPGPYSRGKEKQVEDAPEGVAPVVGQSGERSHGNGKKRAVAEISCGTARVVQICPLPPGARRTGVNVKYGMRMGIEIAEKSNADEDDERNGPRDPYPRRAPAGRHGILDGP